MLTLYIRMLSPARHVYVPVSDSWAECTIRFLLVPSACIVILLLGCISVPSLYHWTTPSALDTTHERTSCSCSTTLLKRSSSGISANVTGGAAEKIYKRSKLVLEHSFVYAHACTSCKVRYSQLRHADLKPCYLENNSDIIMISEC